MALRFQIKKFIGTMGPELAWNMYEAIRLSDNKVGVRSNFDYLAFNRNYFSINRSQPDRFGDRRFENLGFPFGNQLR